jgi:ubiquinone/menaquinone biosynthesis C-methylase UbiE
VIDPIPIDWGRVVLPDAWPDRLDLRHPSHLRLFVSRLFGARRKVEIPADMPGADRIPAYVRQEFHHLPNGFYSKRMTGGYLRWFDRLMLGYVRRAQARLADRLAGCKAVLDVGCGAGGLAGAMHAAGIPEVWGLDPSPYLLQLAARRHPHVRFVQGVVENTEFPTARFAGIGICFLFHELPPRAADTSLDELRRILAPGGTLVIAEPSPVQFRARDLRGSGERHRALDLYFSLIAKWMHEPFVQGWHQRDVARWLREHDFTLVDDEIGMPLRFITARRDTAR